MQRYGGDYNIEDFRIRLPPRYEPACRRACLVVMLLNMATGGGMLYNRQIRPFPFLRNPNAVFSGAPVIHR